jgi:hypothetical protein
MKADQQPELSALIHFSHTVKAAVYNFSITSPDFDRIKPVPAWNALATKVMPKQSAVADCILLPNA